MVAARVNHGRWIVDCPDERCAGAELLEEATAPRAFCADCAREGRTTPFGLVELPTQRKAIEDVLAARPVENQNWEPGETLAELKRENELRGVA